MTHNIYKFSVTVSLNEFAGTFLGGWLAQVRPFGKDNIAKNLPVGRVVSLDSS